METNPDYIPPQIAIPLFFLLLLILAFPHFAAWMRKQRRLRRLRASYEMKAKTEVVAYDPVLNQTKLKYELCITKKTPSGYWGTEGETDGTFSVRS